MKGLDRLHDIADDLDRTAWGRELASALHETAAHIGEEVDHMRDLSGYESDVLAWVEKNGGLEAVKERLMPEGMEWPRFEDGEPVRLGEHWEEDGFDESVTRIDSIEFADDGVRLGNEYTEAFYRPSERVKRPAPEVLDADGAEIRAGDTVWTLKDARELEVTGLYPEQDSCPVKVKEHKNGAYIFSGVEPSDLTHRAPVLAADGKPLREGETVWHIADGRACVVREVREGGAVVEPVDGRPCGRCRADYLTHECPDTWERLEADAEGGAKGYCSERGLAVDGGAYGQAKAVDLVRRAKKLAGVSE